MHVRQVRIVRVLRRIWYDVDIATQAASGEREATTARIEEMASETPARCATMATT
jgi:hypothetical protein